MRVHRDWRHLPQAARGAALAIGNFDGLHLGHQQVIASAREAATREGMPLAVMSFEPHPRRFFGTHNGPIQLEPVHVRLRRLKAAGVDHVFLLRFDATLAAMSAEYFIEEILIDALAVRHVVTGENFVFGKGRGGDTQMLASYAGSKSRIHGYHFHPIPPVTIDTTVCSSTAIRAALRSGDLATAEALLGRRYGITGRVIHGDQRGRELGFPTANIALHDLFCPAYGVYIVEAAMVCETYDCSVEAPEWVAAIANLGHRPTVGGEQPLLEVHLLKNAPLDLYHQRLRVRFHRFLRPEQRFDGLEALKTQITLDTDAARTYWKQHAPAN